MQTMVKSIPLAHATLTCHVREGPDCFTIVSGNKEYIFKLETIQERDSWIEAIKKHVSAVK